MLSERLRLARERAGLGQKEVAAALGVKRPTITYYELGKRKPDPDRLPEIARVLNTTVAFLAEETDDPHRPVPDEIPIGKTRRIPIVEHITFGAPVTAENFGSEWEEVMEEEMDGEATYFFLRVKGNAMEPKMDAGSLALVREQPTVEDGQIAAVLLRGKEEVEFYRVYEDGKRLILKADNPTYPPIASAKNDVHIAGRVMEVRSKV